jgi:hypothetical protein
LVVHRINRDGISPVKKSYRINISKWNEPVFSYSSGYIFYVFGVCLLAFTAVLGWHTPNPFGYAYQLVVPSFICWVFSELIVESKTNLLATLLIIINLFTWENTAMAPRYLEDRSQSEWTRLLGYLDGTKNIIHPPIMVTDVMNMGFAPMDSGQTIIFYTIQPYPDTILADISYEQIRRDGYGFTTGINRRIEKHKYDLIITEKDEAKFFDPWILEQNYMLVDEIAIDMNIGGVQVLQVWKPNP